MYQLLRAELESIFCEDQHGLGQKAVHVRHVKRLKEIIHAYGWPTISRVGVKASQGAWVIAQHADFDVVFQRECLNKLTEAIPPVDLTQLAFLTDRVLKNEGKPQIYGTQYFTDDTGVYGPWPIRARNDLNARRFEMGLESIEEYARRMQLAKPASHNATKE
jgi:hypothetical protein